MLPSNVMSFMKKMVAQEEIVQQSDNNTGGAFGKLKQTLSSSLLTAQDRVNKMSPRPSLIPDTGESQHLQASHAESTLEKENEGTQQTSQTIDKNELNKSTANRAASCRVCLKSFKAEDFSKTCFECKYRVCEDCASYSKIDSSEDLNTWRCSVCRRKMSSRVCIPQDSTDSNLDVPVLEALQRRHSDVKLNATNDQIGLIPPRSPDLRRHSDVSPASFKELEKFSSVKSGSSNNNINNNNDHEWDAIRNIVPGRIEIEPPTRLNSRRQSRVSRQHSYDDEIQKNALASSLITAEDLNLPIQGQIPRRKSAYDVFGGVQPNQQLILQAGELDKPQQQQPPGSRRSSFRIPHDDDKDQDDSPNSDNGPTLLIDDDRRTRRRGSQLPDITALRERGILGANPQGATLSVNPINPYQGPSLEELEAPKKQTSLDGEAIKIVIHDCDSGPVCSSKKRIVLRRDPSDKAHRTRGFGMRVVGGKTGADGRLFAYIVWTVPGGEAEKGGLRQGDKILEWCGISLVDRSFEEVCSIMDRTGDIAELLVEHASDFRMCDLLEDNIGQQQQQQQQQPPSVAVPSIPPTQRKNSELVGLVAEPENNEKSPASPTRRKLPKTPEQALKERQVQGRIQVQVWYHDDRSELVVNLLAADDLSLRDEAFGFGKLPEAYAKVKIVSKTGESNLSQTEVCMPNNCPIWNATLMFEIGNGINLMDSNIEISLLDLIPQNDPLFLGECSVDLKDALINDRATWYRLEDPKSLRAVSLAKCQYFNPSPRNSFSAFAGGDVSRFIRRNDYTVQRSSSQSDCDSIGEGASLLHPDHAWFGVSSRRGSSQSEQLEIEAYQLSKDFSKSLPGSRRSSFQDQERRMMEGAGTPPANINRRRSSCVRKDPDEILKSLKAVRGELGRTMSLCRETEYNSRQSRRGSRISYDYANFEENWRSSQGNFQAQNQQTLSLGPGQRKPKNFVLNSPKYGELFIEFHTTKSCLEIKILSTRNLTFNYTDSPDTFVECFIKDNNDRIRQKRKSDVVRSNVMPSYNTIVQYAMSDIYRRSITFILWQCNIECERNIGLGAIEIYFGNYKFDQIYSGWYPLFPLFSLGLADLLSP